MCFVRKSMDFVFSQEELKWLDNVIPSGSNQKHKSKSKEPAIAGVEDNSSQCSSNSSLSSETVSSRLRNSNEPSSKQPEVLVASGSEQFYDVNISEQVTRTSIWRQLSSMASRDRRLEAEARGSTSGSRLESFLHDRRFKDLRDLWKPNQS